MQLSALPARLAAGLVIALTTSLPHAARAEIRLDRPAPVVTQDLPADPGTLATLNDEVPLISVETGLRLSVHQAEYTSKRYSGDGDISYRWRLSEISSEFRFDREYLKAEGAQAEVQSDEYDVNVKWKRNLLDNPNYVFVSPRLRYNRFGYFRSSQAWSAGVGRRFEPDPRLSLSIEVGPGVRWAQAQDGNRVVEGLYTVAGKVSLDLNEQLSVKLGVVDERSNRENYRTLALALRNRLTERVWLKYELNYRKAFPFDSAPAKAETNFDAGISYRF